MEHTSMSKITEQARFDGLAFPVARVTYGASGYSATIKRDDDTYRARVGYDHALGVGPRSAAMAAYAKLLNAHPGINDASAVVPVPGDVDHKTYTFTFVPVEYFT
jgi:hypothetical protein